jgi:hypothetical protein
MLNIIIQKRKAITQGIKTTTTRDIYKLCVLRETTMLTYYLKVLYPFIPQIKMSQIILYLLNEDC